MCANFTPPPLSRKTVKIIPAYWGKLSVVLLIFDLMIVADLFYVCDECFPKPPLGKVISMGGGKWGGGGGLGHDDRLAGGRGGIL